MAKLGVVAAAKVAGVSRATIARAIEDGRLSATTKKHGKRTVYQIDTAELARCFGDNLQQPDSSHAATSRPHEAKGGDATAATEVRHLRDLVTRLEADLQRARDDAERLRRELAEAHAERRELQSRLMPRAIEDKSGGGILGAIGKLFS